MRGSPSGVTLDQLANGLRERGFRRTSGSPRLITRLKRIKAIEVSRTGLIRVLDDREPARHEPTPSAHPVHHAEPRDLEPADDDDARADGEPEGESDADAAPADGSTEGSAEGGQRRRRRRRGGRRRRGRRGGGGNGGGAEPESGGGDVIAAAPPSTPET